MTIIFMGSEIDSFDVRGVNQRTTVVAGKFDADFCRSAIQHGGGADGASGIGKSFAGGAEFWFHFTASENAAGGSNDENFFEVWDDLNSIRGLFVIDGVNGTYKGQYWNGASYTVMSNGFTFIDDTPTVMDIHIKIHDTLGRFAIYIDGVLHEEFTGDTNLYAGGAVQVDGFNLKSSVGFFQVAYNSAMSFSEVIVADESTVGWRMATIVPTGVGATGAWTGLWSDVDEVTIDDTDFLESNTTAQVETMVASNLSATAGAMDPVAVGVVARARKGSSGVQQIQMAVRTNALDFFSSTLPLDPGFDGSIWNIWELNPDTVAAWTTAEIDAIEIGVKSIT